MVQTIKEPYFFPIFFFQVTHPGGFLGHSGTPAITCSHKAASGFIYPLERGFIFVYKPPIYIRYDEVRAVAFERSGGSTRSFDINVMTANEINYTFSSIEKGEYGRLYEFLKKKNIKLKTPVSTHLKKFKFIFTLRNLCQVSRRTEILFGIISKYFPLSYFCEMDKTRQFEFFYRIILCLFQGKGGSSGLTFEDDVDHHLARVKKEALEDLDSDDASMSSDDSDFNPDNLEALSAKEEYDSEPTTTSDEDDSSAGEEKGEEAEKRREERKKRKAEKQERKQKSGKEN